MTLAERAFIKVMAEEHGVAFVPEYRFHPTRKWRFDFACTEHKVAVEVEGGVWTRGRHTSSAGFLRDMEKYNTATSMGWLVLRVVPTELNSQAFEQLVLTTIAVSRRAL